MSDERLTVLLAVHGEGGALEETLASLEEVRKPSSYGGVVVVENGPRRLHEQTCARHAESLGLRYVHTERANKSAALNLGLEHVEDGLVVMTDDDVRFGAGWLEAFERAWRAHPEATFFGGPLFVDHEVSPDPALLPFMPGATKGWHPHDEDTWVARAGTFLGANWAAPRAGLVAIGGFDPGRGPGARSGATGQESHAQRALARSGWRPRYVHSAHVWHEVHARELTREWLLARRTRSGRELALIVGDRLPRLAWRAGVYAAVLIQHLRFDYTHRHGAYDRTFARAWRAAYLEGALEVVDRSTNDD